MKKRIITLLLALIMVLSLAACGSNDNAASGSDAANAAEETELKWLELGGTEDIGRGGALTAHTTGAMMAQAWVFDGLVDWEDGKVVPALAERWDISDDGTVYTFHIRPDVKFSNGDVFDANVAEMNLTKAVEHKDENSWMALLAHITSIEATDDMTLVITLDETYYPALQELAGFTPVLMLAPSAFPESGDPFTDEIIAPIGTGPWVLDEYKDGEYAKFRRNENYWGDMPAIDGFTLHVIPDGETMAANLESGELDMVYDNYNTSSFNTASFLSFQNKDGFGTAISEEPTMVRLLVMYSDHENLQDLKVRQALIYGLDRDTIGQTVYQGLEYPATGDQYGIFTKNMAYCDVDYENVYDYDQDLANQLLDEAGWVMNDATGIREKDGEQLVITYVYDGSDPDKVTQAQLMQSMYKEIGVDLKMDQTDASTLWTYRLDGSYDMIDYISWGFPYDPHSTMEALNPEDSQIFGLSRKGLSDDEQQALFELFHSAIRESDETERAAIYSEVFNTWNSEAVVIPLSNITNKAAFRDGVGGVTFNGAYDMPLGTITLDK